MADNQPPDNDDTGAQKPKLPPRSIDWQSGLQRKEPEQRRTGQPQFGAAVPGSAYGPESPDWDPVDAAPDNPRLESLTPRDEAAAEAGSNLYAERPQKAPLRDVHPAGTPDSADLPSQETVERHPLVTFYATRTRISDLFIALILAVLAFGSVALTYSGFGHSWDEALYLKPAERAAAWMVGVINNGDDTMLQSDAIDRHFGHKLDSMDPLHPEVAPVAKLLPGAGLTYLKPLGLDFITAMRLPNAILFGLTIALLFLLGTREYGRTGGFAAALFYVLMPRVFGHAHIAASETPLAFFVVLTIWCYLVSNRFWPFALFTGIALGLAIATKITALALPVPLLLWGQLYKRRDYASNIFAMVFIAPVVILAVWPWLWYDGFRRFIAYILFYLDHQKTAVYYLGRIWGYTRGPAAPFYYPAHITAVVVPVWILAFLALGLLRALMSTVRRPVTILFVGMVVFWIGLAMLPNAPRYDGERLWFPAFAFIALLAAGGFSLLFGGVRRWRERRRESGADRESSYIAAFTLLALGVYGAADIYVTHPNELNYYNWVVGRAKGAEQHGFETAYWGEGVNDDVIDYLRTILKPGDKVKTLALNEQVFDNLRLAGRLPEKVDFSPDVPPYDYAILQVRQGFMTPVEIRLRRGKKPLRVFEAGGVTNIMIFDSAALANVFPAPADGGTSAPAQTRESASVDSLPTPATTASLSQPPVTDATTPLVPETTATLSDVNRITTGSAAAILPVDTEMTTIAAVRGREPVTTASASGNETTTGEITSPTAVLELDGASSQTSPLNTGSTAAVSLRQSDAVVTAEEDLSATSTAAMANQTSGTVALPAPDVATSTTLELPTSSGDTRTSAGEIYSGDLPSTETLQEL